MKYADKRRSPCVVIQGDDERNSKPEMITIKDLVKGAQLSETITDNTEWRETPSENPVAGISIPLKRATSPS